MRIRTISVALGLSAVVVLTLLLVGLGQTARGTGSGPFGDGSDGAKTYSVSETDAPKDAVVDSGTASSTTLVVSGVGSAFVAGEKILIHQTRGNAAGSWEMNTVQSYGLGNITTVSPLVNSYNTSGADAAQVVVVREFTDLTVDAGVTVSAKAWNGSVGGIYAVFADGTATINGAIVANGAGYRGEANGGGIDEGGKAGEGSSGPPVTQTAANGNGGGGSAGGGDTAGGGGGGHATAGQTGGTGTLPPAETPGQGGGAVGVPELTAVFFGGAGGNAGNNGQTQAMKRGGNGGGLVIIFAETYVGGSSASLSANGDDGDGAQTSNQGGHGGGGQGVRYSSLRM